jgi:serine/threonine-protein kinase
MSYLIGQTLLGQFHVDAFVASGSMGAVYLVTDLKRNAPLAMKVLHADLADDPTVFKRFQREAQALRQLKHPNIVPFYGLYQDQSATFLLEAFIPGSSLQQILRENHKLPVKEVLAYMKGLCAALGYAHSLNIVHCDVKPGNVMVDHKGGIYLTDFGIARFVGTTTTTTMGVAGTPAYMAPEQIVGRGIGPATDIYALGVVLYEILTGQKPFRGTEPETEAGGDTPSDRIRYGHLRVLPPDPRQVNPAISPRMVQVMLKALAKNPTERFLSTQDFFAAICWAVQARAEDVSEEATILGQVMTQPPVNIPPISKPQKSSKSWLIATGIGLSLLCLSAIVIGGLTVLNRPGSGFAVTQVPDSTVIVSTLKPSSQPESAVTQTLDATSEVFPTIDLSILTESIDTVVSPTLIIESPTFAPPTGSTKENVSPNDGMTLIYVPVGEFAMGANVSRFDQAKPEHTVYLDAFWIDKIEVTNGMFALYASQTGYVGELERQNKTYYYAGDTNWPDLPGAGWRNPFGLGSTLEGRTDYPVIQVTWNDAVAYCEWAGRRLPTEAEWEKAARGPDAYLYPWGNTPPSSNLANYGDQIGDIVRVGSYPENVSPYGALDMAGNVYEWVADYFSTTYYASSPPSNPTGPDSGKYRVMRGGSWQLEMERLLTYEREVSQPSYGNSNLGFRCAMDANP